MIVDIVLIDMLYAGSDVVLYRFVVDLQRLSKYNQTMLYNFVSEQVNSNSYHVLPNNQS